MIIFAKPVLEAAGQDTVRFEDEACLAFRVGASFDASYAPVDADDVPTITTVAEFWDALNPVRAILDVAAYMDVACAISPTSG